MPIGYVYNLDQVKDSVRFKLKPNWQYDPEEKFTEGIYYGQIILNKVPWAIVLFDGEEDPTFFKANGIYIQAVTWVEAIK